MRRWSDYFLDGEDSGRRRFGEGVGRPGVLFWMCRVSKFCWTVVVLSDQLDVVVWSLEKIKKKMYRMHVDVI